MPDQHAAPDGLPPRRRLWGLLTLQIATTMTVLDGAIANVALPHIASALHANIVNSIWVVNAYQLCLMVLMLPFASLGEIVGYRVVSQTGMAVFTTASLACALSHSLPMLVVARMVQGTGAALLLSVNSALLRTIYPRAMLGRAVGIMALTVGVSASIAPSIASAILSVAPWPFLFAVNVPFGLVAFAIARFTLPAVPGSGNRFDWLSALLSGACLGLLVIGVDAIAHPHHLPRVAATLAVSAIAGVVLVRRQVARTAPLLPVDLLRIPAFALAVATSICAFCAQTVAFVAMPFLMEYGLGLGQVATGLLMTPWPLVTGITAPIAGRLADRYPAGILAGAGLLIMSGGAALLATLPAHPALREIAWRMAACGLGFGLFQSPNNRAMLGASPQSRSGGASGMLGTARTLGQTLGAALVALVFGLLGAHAVREALLAACAIAALAATISLSRLKLT